MQIRKIALITMTMRHAKSEKVVNKEKFGLRFFPGVGDTIIPSSGKSSSSTTSCRKSSRIISVYQIANKKVRPQGTMKPADGQRLRKNITTAQVTGSERDRDIQNSISSPTFNAIWLGCAGRISQKANVRKYCSTHISTTPVHTIRRNWLPFTWGTTC